MSNTEQQIVIEDRRDPGWWWADNVLVDEYLPVIGPQAFACYCVLARMAGPDGSCYPTYRGIGKKLGCDKRTAMRHVASLVEAGLVQAVFRTNDKGEPISNVYRLLKAKAGVVPEPAAEGVGVVTRMSLPSDTDVTTVVTRMSPKEDSCKQDSAKHGGATQTAFEGTSPLKPPPYLNDPAEHLPSPKAKPAPPREVPGLPAGFNDAIGTAYARATGGYSLRETDKALLRELVADGLTAAGFNETVEEMAARPGFDKKANLNYFADALRARALLDREAAEQEQRAASERPQAEINAIVNRVNDWYEAARRIARDELMGAGPERIAAARAAMREQLAHRGGKHAPELWRRFEAVVAEEREQFARQYPHLLRDRSLLAGAGA